MARSALPSTWTNPSVLRLIATGDDPIECVIGKARSLVLQAADAGWSGPPFDPIALCKILRIDVLPSQDVDDARTVPVGDDAVRIEFNPLRPRGRLRFSVAHELAHTLFPDCAEQVRNRVAQEDMRGDEWQLEMLCNIAAAEIIMPAGHFANLKDESLDVDHLMDLRKKYDVSTEAVFLRAIRLTETDCLMFAASRNEEDGGKDGYTIDYAMRSRNASASLSRGSRLPKATVVSECTAIGFTAKGLETWSGVGSVMVECVGVPPYPGSRYPRVVGLIRPSNGNSVSTSMIQYLRGDALEPRGDGDRVVAHIVNDKTPNWGGGFALAVRKRYPGVQEDFQAWVSADRSQLHLGSVRFAKANAALTIASMVAQHGYGPSPTPRLRYQALATCLETLATFAIKGSRPVHMPRIGCGNAGGTWDVVSTLIDEIVCSKGIPVTVYDVPDAPTPSRGLFAAAE